METLEGFPENVNGSVNSILITACLDRVLAQVEVAFSNSMVESFWRSMKHSVARDRTLVEFYVNEHNTKMPHPAFGGQTDETFFATGSNLPEDLALAKSKARAARLDANRAASCERCIEQQAYPPEGTLSS
jgi:hypothetical protein